MSKNTQTTSEEPRNELAVRLSELMAVNHWSRSDMAKIADVSPTSVTNWFKRGTISKESAAKLASASRTSLSWILTGVEEGGGVFSADELELIDVYRELPPVERRNMLSAFQMRLQQLKEFYANYADPTTRQK
ncbi:MULTISPECIES: helix-turn-helix domain-containing protein [Cronobacter]|uniref:helix-turn-helix domain-containing protein n=1 Tax=Cronobacter TaxID=413496 RepID=UPI002106FB8B|nr:MULTISPECIES: helix-turn-helix domain-containing protein [Cronobacter]MDK1182943.1 helix-turn-helix domain-containing protein [Cronobacter turicensis]MDK1194071.1 helix-turn-helix domain-containing protein [Cronobacter dublinensis]MDK1200929.1 helix-turn-helix domain-containing protein [Cronobacter dublinensis]MDK1208290.1 helix-turn-helix domain-containing protein [Cronobacter turicensis]MDK1216806.1 helix-turn-helix domain-containing protein [Cronobacter turicensis]